MYVRVHKINIFTSTKISMMKLFYVEILTTLCDDDVVDNLKFIDS